MIRAATFGLTDVTVEEPRTIVTDAVAVTDVSFTEVAVIVTHSVGAGVAPCRSRNRCHWRYVVVIVPFVFPVAVGTDM